MKSKTLGWLGMLGILAGLLLLAACSDDDGDDAQVVVVTNVVDGQTTVVTNVATGPTPQSLYDSTLSLPEAGTVQSDSVTAPDDGTITATADWSGIGAVHVRLLRNGAAQTGAIDISPITMSARTDDGNAWVVRLDNDTSPGAENVHVTIGEPPDE